VWSASRPGHLYPGKDPVPIVQEAGWAPEPVWIGAEMRGLYLSEKVVAAQLVSRFSAKTQYCDRKNQLLGTVLSRGSQVSIVMDLICKAQA
jgi:hypothetical protein